MRALVAAAAGLCLLTMTAGADPAKAAGATQTPIVLAQAEPKKETLTHEVKRKVKKAWKNIAGYKFDVGCPGLIPLTHSTCTETGRNRAAAQAKCQAANPLCSVGSVK
ncbi:MAG: hypothetical protein ABI830_02780 [Pseudolabrys sp.]